ncbi:unnamed protein product [Linum trigynum]|uniref:Uncharacterized protein n=1 Tax=Linum trigynum TaxID=586398 RepID=A0AAV2CZS8_9ROSI
MLSCTREQRRDVIVYPPLPTLACPSFRDGEHIVPQFEPPWRRKQNPQPNIEELRLTQQTELPEPFAYEWTTATEGIVGSLRYSPSPEWDIHVSPQFHHQHQIPMYQPHNNSLMHRATTTLLVHLNHLYLHHLWLLRWRLRLKGIRERFCKKKEADREEEGVEDAVEAEEEGEKGGGQNEGDQ